MLGPDVARLLKASGAWKRLVFPLLIPVLLGCALESTQTPAAVSTPVPSPTLPPTAYAPGSDLGTSKNPLIVALPPSPTASREVIAAGNTLIGLLAAHTGYKIVSVLPPTETDLVAGFGTGNAHIGVLSPYAYLLASNAGTAEAAFAREQNGSLFYGAQFIAHADTGFTSYYDAVNNGNVAEPPVALAQFQQKKPCWTDERSPSGYVVPLGYLNEVHVVTREPAFLAGHVAVVRAIDVGGICDFGATYIDARTYPGLQDEYPDLLRKVNVIWRIPNIIPYETLVFTRGMDDSMRRALTRAFVELMTTPDGKSAMQILYGFQAMQVAQDSQYDDFRRTVKDSGLDLNELIK